MGGDGASGAADRPARGRSGGVGRGRDRVVSAPVAGRGRRPDRAGLRRAGAGRRGDRRAVLRGDAARHAQAQDRLQPDRRRARPTRRGVRDAPARRAARGALGLAAAAQRPDVRRRVLDRPGRRRLPDRPDRAGRRRPRTSSTGCSARCSATPTTRSTRCSKSASARRSGASGSGGSSAASPPANLQAFTHLFPSSDTDRRLLNGKDRCDGRDSHSRLSLDLAENYRSL